jgi:hypothetical protein
MSIRIGNSKNRVCLSGIKTEDLLNDRFYRNREKNKVLKELRKRGINNNGKI